MGISPFLATVGTVAKNQTLLDWAASASSHNGVFWIGAAILLLAGLLLTSGTRRYFTTQKVLFTIAIVGTVVLVGRLAFGSRSTFSAHLSRLGGLDYDKVIDTAQANGYVHAGFDLGSSAKFLVWPLLPLLGAVQSVGIGGEVKRVRRSQLWGILGALVSCVLVIALFDLLAVHAFGDVFQGAIAYNSSLIANVPEGSTESTVGALPYITVLSGILAGNNPLAVVILATFAAWIWFWVPAELAYTTRSMIAWSFDRVAPNRLGYVSERFHTPVVAIWTSTAGAVVFMWLIAYRNIALLTLIEALLVAWGAVMVAAMIFPYRRRAMYAGSPVGRLRWFGVPAMTVTGASRSPSSWWSRSCCGRTRSRPARWCAARCRGSSGSCSGSCSPVRCGTRGRRSTGGAEGSTSGWRSSRSPSSDGEALGWTGRPSPTRRAGSSPRRATAGPPSGWWVRSASGCTAPRSRRTWTGSAGSPRTSTWWCRRRVAG